MIEFRGNPCTPHITAICLIEVPGTIAKLNLIPWGKSRGSELSNGGFRLQIGQLLKKLSLFWSLRTILGPPNYGGGARLLGEVPITGRIWYLYTKCFLSDDCPYRDHRSTIPWTEMAIESSSWKSRHQGGAATTSALENREISLQNVNKPS